MRHVGSGGDKNDENGLEVSPTPAHISVPVLSALLEFIAQSQEGYTLLAGTQFNEGTQACAAGFHTE